MVRRSSQPSLSWTLFLLFLFTTQIQDSEAGLNFKLKKLLKRVLLLRALSGKKIAIIPIPIPLNLFMKDKMEGMKMEGMKMEGMKMPEQMPPMPHYPMYMPSGGYEMMMMPKENEMMPPPMMMPKKKYGMMGGE